jgi:hypothetical protein
MACTMLWARLQPLSGVNGVEVQGETRGEMCDMSRQFSIANHQPTFNVVARLLSS